MALRRDILGLPKRKGRRRLPTVSSTAATAMYVLHDEPLSPFEAMQLDPDYLGLVSQALTRLQVLAQRMARHGWTTPVSQSEVNDSVIRAVVSPRQQKMNQGAVDFWFQLARWIDSTILDALYGWGFGANRPHSNFDPLIGLNNAFGDMLLNFVMAMMFIVLPTFWVMALAWAGVRTGNIVQGLSTATSDARHGQPPGQPVAPAPVVRVGGHAHVPRFQWCFTSDTR